MPEYKMDQDLEQAVRQFMESNFETFKRKNADYSRDNIHATGENGVASRAMDKVARLVNLINGGGNPEFEDMEETWGDLFNYAIIGYLKTTGKWSPSTNMVYLAGPIDDIGITIAKGWRDRVGDALRHHQITCFSPIGAFMPSAQNPNREAIRSINRHAILQCNVVLANLAGTGRGFGTTREIEFAVANHIRVIAVGDFLHQHFESFDIEIVTTLDEAITRLTFGKSDE